MLKLFGESIWRVTTMVLVLFAGHALLPLLPVCSIWISGHSQVRPRFVHCVQWGWFSGHCGDGVSRWEGGRRGERVL